MARRCKTDSTERRTATVTIQLTPTERATLDERVATAGIRCMSDFARAALLGYDLHVKDPLYEPALHELFAIGNNLNQLAKHANTTGQIDPQELRDALNLFREAINRLHD